MYTEPATSLDDGLAVAEEIRSTIENASFLDREWGFSMPALRLRGILSASIGIAQHVPDTNATLPIEQEKNILLKRADTAMYRAKSQGKNQVVVSRMGEDMTSNPGGELSTAIG